MSDDDDLQGLLPGWRGVEQLVQLGSADRGWQEPEVDEGLDQLSRRGLFKWLGASSALAAFAGCSSRPEREIRPYVRQPREVTPGVAQLFATALIEDGFATGVVVEAHEGRPTKIEGNPDHPASLGATRPADQAAVLSLFDPQRVRNISDRGAPAAWSDIEQFLESARHAGGAGLHVVLEPTSSPIVIDLVTRLRATLPRASVTFWAPLEPRASLEGNALAFGRPLQTHVDLRRADVVLTLDADLLGDHPMRVAYARQLSDRRRVANSESAMNRIYAVEAAYTITGVVSDHRFRVRSGGIESIARGLIAELASRGVVMPIAGERLTDERVHWLGAVADDLGRARGRSVVIAGERQPAIVHALVAIINYGLGNVGGTVTYTAPVVFEAGQASHSLESLAAGLARGGTTRVVILDGNPVYTAPRQLELSDAIAGVPSLYLGRYANETAAACRYVVPSQHVLEQWDLARAFDGTLTPIQPLIGPLFGGRSPSDVLAALLGDPPASARSRVESAWARAVPEMQLEAGLALGCAVSSASRAETIAAPVAPPTAPVAAAPELELDMRPHPFVYDGRHTNNPWLLELPTPITKLTWDNAALMSSKTAAHLGVASGDIVAIHVDQYAVDVPALVAPGHVDDAITLHFGFGRDGGERIARGVGANTFALWRGPFQSAATVTRRGGHRELAITQDHWRMEHRPIALRGSLAELGTDAWLGEVARHRGTQPSLLAHASMAGEQWAMSIDLTTCSGCSACVMACSAENNTPVVGRKQVLKRREMHWLRIDRYLDDASEQGDAERGDVAIAVLPMLCQHCELAPCEYVCPVEATSHSHDGINEMTYNRCVGTRFCSNNCPYKVRRFNWFDFKQHHGLQILARNPDVTVRDRGVMEKCTYCVQRIRRTEIDARVAGRAIGATEVRTACQQACPTQAITFGSITNPESTVTEQRKRPHSYEVLHDQGTRPRTTYLARIRNPNPELE